MAIYLRDFETQAEFISAYTGGEYVEPWVSYIEETEEVAFNKAELLEIKIVGLSMENDVPATGKTVDKNDCEYTVIAFYDDYTEKDITDEAVVTGSLVVEESELTSRHSAGTLTLTATYSGFNDSESVTVWQEAAEPYLTFDILSGGNIAFGCYPNNDESGISLTIEYKVNNGEWTSLTSQLPVPPESTEGEENEFTPEDVVNAFPSKISVNAGDIVQFRGNNAAYSILSGESGNEDIYCMNMFFSNAWFNVKGNIMSLVDKVNFKTLTTLASSYTFSYLFSGCYNMVSAEDLILPATTLTEWCYYNMFYNFLYDMGMEAEMKLSSAPALPATTLADSCYQYMFGGCTSLTSAPELPATTLASECYSGMFQECTSLTTAPALPATTLTEDCYSNMFADCTSLTTAPELPATTLAQNCYNSMFAGCTSLTSAPAILPATTLSESCYNSMFSGCINLTEAPVLPATTLANYCYNYMFDGCTSLTSAPELPATTLAENCYDSMFIRCASLTAAPELSATALVLGCYQFMFDGCTSLTTAPELPATTLAAGCYYCMFQGCTSLNYIKCLATDIFASNCTYNWVSGSASSGTFVKNTNMSSWRTGDNGIPNGWTIEDDS